MVFDEVDIGFIVSCAMHKKIFDPYILFLNTKPAKEGPLYDKNAYLRPHKVIELESSDHADIKKRMQAFFKEDDFKSNRKKRDGLILVPFMPMKRVKSKKEEKEQDQDQEDRAWWFYDAKGETKHYETMQEHIIHRISKMNLYIHTNIKGLYTVQELNSDIRVSPGAVNINRIIDGVNNKLVRDEIKRSLLTIIGYLRPECHIYLDHKDERVHDSLICIYGFYYGPLDKSQ